MAIKNLFLALTCTGLLTMPVTAQTFTTLYYFTNSAEGYYPRGNLVLSGNMLYGTTAYGGGTNEDGTVFAVTTNGSSFTNLYIFSAQVATNQLGDYTNRDGVEPEAGLILSGNTLYGTANNGGANGNGTVFALATSGTVFTNLHSFSLSPTNSLGVRTNSDGAFPNDNLVLSGNTLYGTASEGGTNSDGAYGTVFSVTTNGAAFSTLYTFSSSGFINPYDDGGYTNSNGGSSYAGLVIGGDTLYGTTDYGGTNGNGTVFAVNTNGTGFTVLHTFTPYNSADTFLNNDGANPVSELVLSDNTLYGTTVSGGTNGNGTLFSVNTNGSNFTVLHTFLPFVLFFTNSVTLTTNGDGLYPNGLILSGNTLYGTAASGGINGNGTVFSVTTNGTNFTLLHTFLPFTGNSGELIYNADGAEPVAVLLLSGNTLYGTTSEGGPDALGTVFSLTLGSAPPQLTIMGSGTNVILAWPTNTAGFILEFATNLVSPVWNTNLPVPVVVNTNNAVTNGVSGTQRFYRLSQ